ncbi:hypothetical protein PCE1_003889 [Barthelona sp. PCE]
MSKDILDTRKPTNNTSNNVPKCSFGDSEFWLSQCDDRTWKLTSFSKKSGLSTHTQLDPEISSLISDALPFGKAFMACSSIYGSLGVVSSNSRDGVCETHYRTFKHDDDGIQILNQVVFPEVHTHISVFDRAMGAITTNQSVLTTYIILKNGSLVDKTKHNLPFPITNFVMCPYNWVIATKQMHLNDSAVGLFNLDSEEQSLLPCLVTSLDISITVNNSFTFEACNVMNRRENVFISLSFLSAQLYTMSTSNIDIDNTIQNSMNMTVKPGIIAPANTEYCQTLPVIDISAPTALLLNSVDVPVCVDHEPHAISTQIALKNEVPESESENEIEVEQYTDCDFDNYCELYYYLFVESEMLCFKYSELEEKYCTELCYNSEFEYKISGNDECAVICEYSGTSGTFYLYNFKDTVFSYVHCFEFDVSDDISSIEHEYIINAHGKFILLCVPSDSLSVTYVYNTNGNLMYTERERARIKNLYVNNEVVVVEFTGCDFVHTVITDDEFRVRKRFSIDLDYHTIRPFRNWVAFDYGPHVYEIESGRMYRTTQYGSINIMKSNFNERDMERSIRGGHNIKACLISFFVLFILLFLFSFDMFS